MNIFLSRSCGERVKVLRYHPTPPGSAPPPGPEGLSSLKSPSIAQSWGSRSFRHELSSKSGVAISGESARINFHPSLKLRARGSAAIAQKVNEAATHRRQSNRAVLNFLLTVVMVLQMFRTVRVLWFSQNRCRQPRCLYCHDHSRRDDPSKL